MKSTVIRKGATASIILGFGALLSACGGGGGGGSSSAASGNTITGYTVDGPFSASVYVYNSSGSLCGETVSSSQDGSFTVSLSPGCSSGPYLISATASSGTDAGIYYYVASQTLQGIYVTPASTAMVEANTGHYSMTGVLAYFTSNPNSLTNMESQETQYNGSSLTFVHVFLPYSLSSPMLSTPQSSSLVPEPIGTAMEELIYPLLPSSSYKNVPVLIKDYALGNLSSNVDLAFPMGTLAGTLSEISNTVLSLTMSPYATESITFSGSLNNPLSLSILGLLTSFSNYSYTFYTSPGCSPSQSVCNSSSTVSAIMNYSGYEFITNGNGLESITSVSNGTSTYSVTSFSIISHNPIIESSSCSILNSTTMVCSIFGNSTTISIQPGPSQGIILKGPFVSPFLFLNVVI